MNREILYRGINFQKEWVYGDLFHSYANDDIAIAYYREGSKTPTFDAIFPESVGQYTGLTDKNGVKIFEGDIVEFTNLDLPNMVIRFDNGSFMLCEGENSTYEELRMNYVVEVVGNIHDNPELIKKSV